jgi:transcriptional regulator with XRE-family HTH domain
MKYRYALGEVLRELRLEKHLTLRDVCGRGKIALGYLSEVERGHKEVSSEILESICIVLGINIAEVLILTAFKMGVDFYDTPEEILDNYLTTSVVSK